MPKWTYKDGAWIPADEHTTGKPTIHGIEAGSPPAGFVHTPTAAQIADRKTRRFDKPSERNVSDLRRQREAEAAKKRRAEVEQLVRGAKKDLASGKVRIDPDIFAGGSVPYTRVTDERGIDHIVTKDKAPDPGPSTAERITKLESELQQIKTERDQLWEEKRDNLLHQRTTTWGEVKAEDGVRKWKGF